MRIPAHTRMGVPYDYTRMGHPIRLWAGIHIWGRTVVTCYARDGFQRYPNSSHLCLGMIFDCRGTGKRKTL